MFQGSADLVLAFAFDTIGVNRIEARASVLNGRGNGAMMKLGAVQEAILWHSLRRAGEALDQALHAILEHDWRPNRGRISATGSIH